MTLELELRGITKRFPGVVANDRIDLDVRKGEIHALMGENGAGKSTLMSILYGLLHPDEGEIWVRGERQHFSSPNDAIAAPPARIMNCLRSIVVSSRFRGARGRPAALAWLTDPEITPSEVRGRSARVDEDQHIVAPEAPLAQMCD